MTTIQARVVVAKKVEVLEGPDDADIVVSVAMADAGVDPVVSFMQGRLKATGHTGRLFDLLADGTIAAKLAAALARAD